MLTHLANVGPGIDHYPPAVFGEQKDVVVDLWNVFGPHWQLDVLNGLNYF